MHKLLKRQLRKLGLDADTVPDLKTWTALLSRIEQTYHDADEHRYLLERSLDLSSQEMHLYFQMHANSENRVRLERDRLRAVINSIYDGIFLLDLEGRILSANPAAGSLLGDSAENLNGQEVFSLLKYNGTDKSVISSIGDAKSWHKEEVELSLNGQEIPVAISVIPVLDNEKATGSVLLIRDMREQVTARKVLERALADAQEAAQTKTMFLANMSHEIRTPLNGITGMLGLLLETRMSREQKDYADIAYKSSQTLLSIINDILDFSKLEAGSIELESIEFNLWELVEDSVELSAHVAHEKGVEIAVSIESTVPRMVSGDPSRLRQVLVNLSSNATKFTSKGSVILRVSSEATNSHGFTALFEVEDTGIGIPPEQIPALFSPFTQGDASTTRRFGGTGLGLAISKQLVEVMGGEISVTSDLSKGSCFRFFVPLRRIAKENRSRTRSSQQFPAFFGKRVLIVNAHEISIGIYEDYLRRWGCRTMKSKTAKEAITKVCNQNESFDAMIIDQELQDMVGIDLAKLFRENAVSIPIILVATMSDRRDTDKEIGTTIDYCLTKPVRIAQLQKALTTALGARMHQMLERKNLNDLYAAGMTIPPSKPNPLRILVVEDNVVNQKVVSVMLKNLRYSCDVVENGRQAVEAVSKSSYDLIFMDCQMPEMDGFEATRHIRKINLESQPYIVAMTANAMEGDRERCINVGMDDYLSKPLTLATLGPKMSQYEWAIETKAMRLMVSAGSLS